MRHARARLGFALVFAGVGLLLIVAVADFYASASQSRMSQLLGELTGASGTDSSAAGREARAKGLVGRIVSERIGLDAMVLEGTSHHDLLRGVGHLRASARPGERGNVVLAGHRDTYFSSLQSIREGDCITLETTKGGFAYEVDSILVVEPTRVDLMEKTRTDQLTLITCYPFYWIGPAPRRFVVRARPLPHEPRAALIKG